LKRGSLVLSYSEAFTKEKSSCWVDDGEVKKRQHRGLLFVARLAGASGNIDAKAQGIALCL